MEMQSSQSMETLHRTSEEGSGNTIPIIVSILAVLIAVIAVVVAAVGLAQSGQSSVVINGLGGTNDGSNAAALNGNDDDERIWLFALGHYGASGGYLDEATGQIKGFNVDIPNAVCRIAGKNCQFVEDIWSNCWDATAGQTPKGGTGLMARYYDACVAWLQTYERRRAFGFTDPFSVEETDVVFAVKAGNSGTFDHRDISGKVIGFVDGWVYDEHCVARDSNIGGTPIATENIRHFTTDQEMVAAIIDESIDAGFAFKTVFEGDDGIELVDEHATTCDLAGRSMMTRKDNKMAEWWNPAFEALLKSTEYQLICNDLTEQHGHLPGPKEICIKT